VLHIRVVLHQYRLGRQLVARLQFPTLDRGPQLIGDLSIRRPVIHAIKRPQRHSSSSHPDD
jgi:hypothetical protein